MQGKRNKKRDKCEAELCLTLGGRETGMRLRDRPKTDRQTWGTETSLRQRQRLEEEIQYSRETGLRQRDTLEPERQP